jgi:hypothetical protein
LSTQNAMPEIKTISPSSKPLEYLRNWHNH